MSARCLRCGAGNEWIEGAATHLATTRERELRATIQRLREANRRLQVTGPALERDRFIAALLAAAADETLWMPPDTVVKSG